MRYIEETVCYRTPTSYRAPGFALDGIIIFVKTTFWAPGVPKAASILVNPKILKVSHREKGFIDHFYECDSFLHIIIPSECAYPALEHIHLRFLLTNQFVQ